jgi:zinc protease
MTAVTTRPAPGPPRPYHFPSFTQARLANGAVLLVAPVHRLPVCSLAVVVDAGAELDPAGLEGCAVMTARAMEEGTLQYQGLEFTERLERIGAALSATADWDSASFSMAVMAENCRPRSSSSRASSGNLHFLRPNWRDCARSGCPRSHR